MLDLDLSNKAVSDISSLADNLYIGERARIDLRGNPLDDEAYDVHIPALEKRSVEMLFGPKP